MKTLIEEHAEEIKLLKLKVSNLELEITSLKKNIIQLKIKGV